MNIIRAVGISSVQFKLFIRRYQVQITARISMTAVSFLVLHQSQTLPYWTLLNLTEPYLNRIMRKKTITDVEAGRVYLLYSLWFSSFFVIFLCQQCRERQHKRRALSDTETRPSQHLNGFHVSLKLGAVSRSAKPPAIPHTSLQWLY
jgi:hypothetical protein